MIDTTRPIDRTGNSYCGPLVLAGILGTSTGVIAAEVAKMRCEHKGARLSDGRVRRVRGRTAEAIRGTYDSELFGVLAAAGYRWEAIDVGARYVTHRKAGPHAYVDSDFKQWQRGSVLFALNPDHWHPCTLLERRARPLWQVATRLLDGVFIVHLPNHWALCADGRWCETYTSGQWVPLRAAPKSYRRVLDAWRISK